MTDPKAQAMAVLQKNHLRVTKQRKMLIDLLVANPDRYVSVTEVDKHMRQAFPGASHNTVYRNLEEFQEIGLVELSLAAWWLSIAVTNRITITLSVSAAVGCRRFSCQRLIGTF